MRVPTRRSEKLRQLVPLDHYVTPEKLQRLKDELARLLGRERKEAIAEVQRGAEMGDFSENVGYQIAKANLRKLNARILNLEERIKQAIPIESGTDREGRIRIGSTVTLKSSDREATYQILGSQESNPAKGFISHGSPLGKLLVGRRVGENITLQLPHEETNYHILNVT